MVPNASTANSGQTNAVLGNSSGYPMAERLVYGPVTALRQHQFLQRHSPKHHFSYISSSMPTPAQTGTGLGPNAALGAIRPEFRKCQSQPSRSLSPASIRSYSPLIIDPLNPSINYASGVTHNRAARTGLAFHNQPINCSVPVTLPTMMTPGNLPIGGGGLSNATLQANASFSNATQPNVSTSISYGYSSQSMPLPKRQLPQVPPSRFTHANSIGTSIVDLQAAAAVRPLSRSSILFGSTQNAYEERLSPRMVGNMQSDGETMIARRPLTGGFRHQYLRGGDYTSRPGEEEFGSDEEVMANRHRSTSGTTGSAHNQIKRPLEAQRSSESCRDKNGNRRDSRSIDMVDRISLDGQMRLDDDQANKEEDHPQLAESQFSMDTRRRSAQLEAQLEAQMQEQTGSRRRSLRNKNLANVTGNESGEESENSSLAKSIGSNVSDCKKTSRTLG
jgi:hypothetical protein